MLIMFNQNVSLQHFRGVEARSIGMFVNKNNPRQQILSNLLRSVLMQLQEDPLIISKHEMDLASLLW